MCRFEALRAAISQEMEERRLLHEHQLQRQHCQCFPNEHIMELSPHPVPIEEGEFVAEEEQEGLLPPAVAQAMAQASPVVCAVAANDVRKRY